MKFLSFFTALLTLLMFSCVTPKIHNDLIEENETNKKNIIQNSKKLLKLENEISFKKNEINKNQKRIRNLKADSVDIRTSYSSLQNKHDDLKNTYDLLVSSNARSSLEKAREIKNLLEQLDQSRTDLHIKEDKLNKISASLESKEDELINAQDELHLRSQRVLELEKLISKKDSIVSSLKNSISNALVGLEGEGLTVVQKNGKIYISLEEQLLFASGKYQINDEGKLALKKLSDVLALQSDLDIIVEGHTDSISYNRGQLKDNWDLSVMRSTSVIKIMLQNKLLKPNQLTAAGKAEFVPISSNNTSEGRSANRRIEMILSPNLDDLFDLLSE
tara:strand:- start:3091 stop:4086 length:996 start_codon:yes stop_codon:yes gene_type:complete